MTDGACYIEIRADASARDLFDIAESLEEFTEPNALGKFRIEVGEIKFEFYGRHEGLSTVIDDVGSLEIKAELINVTGIECHDDEIYFKSLLYEILDSKIVLDISTHF